MDFEILPVGTKERLKTVEEKLQTEKEYVGIETSEVLADCLRLLREILRGE